jgi:UV DNA damage endonuclease
MAVESWPKGITPQCHHSNSKKNYENPKVGKTAHSDWYYEPFQDLGHTLDVVLEAKMKEKSLIKYSKDFS